MPRSPGKISLTTRAGGGTLRPVRRRGLPPTRHLYPAQQLAIDPTRTLGSYLGGGSTNYCRGIAVDNAGAISVVGASFPADFLGGGTRPTGLTDVIVLKLTPTGDALVYNFIAGGHGSDTAVPITVNGAGEVFVRRQ